MNINVLIGQKGCEKGYFDDYAFGWLILWLRAKVQPNACSKDIILMIRARL
jgi:hypothetical protein